MCTIQNKVCLLPYSMVHHCCSSLVSRENDDILSQLLHCLSFLWMDNPNPDSHVRNLQQFAQFITTQNVPDSEVLVPFDVVSLFTRVPTSRAIQVTCDRLVNDPSLPDRTSLTVDDICSLLQLCLEATYLAFEGKVYRQIHGTSMGSPVSVVVANLVIYSFSFNFSLVVIYYIILGCVLLLF